MNVSVHDPKRISLCCLLVALVSSGCQMAPRQPALLGSHRIAEQATVTTGGTFAHARTIAIPESGLSLGDAVEQSIRSGVATRVDQLPASSAAQRGMATSVLGNGSTPATATAPTQTVTDAMDRLFEIARSGNLNEGVVQATAAIMATGDNVAKVLERLRKEDVASTAKEVQVEGKLTLKQIELVNQVSIIVNGEVPQPLSTESSSQPAELTAEEKQKQASAARSVVSNMPNDYMLRLVRKGEPVRNLPLELVRMTPAGDIQMENGDRVELISYSQTSLGRRNLSSGLESNDPIVRLTGMVRLDQPVNGETSIDSLGQLGGQSEYNSMMDLMILRPALPNNSNEEYWFPRMKSEAYRGLTTFAETNSQRVIGGDEVKFAALSLTPLIRAGQIRSRLKDRLAMDQEQTRIQELVKAKSKQEQNLLEQATVVPGVTSLIEACNDFGSAIPRFSL